MKLKDDLIYKLIFSEEKDFIILITDYIDDIYKYDKFISDIKSILDKSNVIIVKDSIEVLANNVKWKLKIKK